MRFLAGCFLWHSYIKPQLRMPLLYIRKVVSYGIPTSNHNRSAQAYNARLVVSYGIPTSNHNHSEIVIFTPLVVSYGIPTSNHNPLGEIGYPLQLFLMAFLHQTTTLRRKRRQLYELFLMAFLHQTTTTRYDEDNCNALFLMAFLHQTTTGLFFTDKRIRCFLWHSYIKPQQFVLDELLHTVVSYGIPTSNHNP